MRPALRTAVVLALAVPLVAPALPASAATTSHFHEKGAFAAAAFEGSGTPDGLPGNYTLAELSFHAGVAEGFVETFFCQEGETPWGDENEENTCAFTGAFVAWGEGVTITKSRGKVKSSTYSGTVDLYADSGEEEGEESEGGEAVAEGVPFNVTFTRTGRPSRSTVTDSYRDPESGESYRYRETQVIGAATVRGSLDGIDAVDGIIGRYSLQVIERTG